MISQKIRNLLCTLVGKGFLCIADNDEIEASTSISMLCGILLQFLYSEDPQAHSPNNSHTWACQKVENILIAIYECLIILHPLALTTIHYLFHANIYLGPTPYHKIIWYSILMLCLPIRCDGLHQIYGCYIPFGRSSMKSFPCLKLSLKSKPLSALLCLCWQFHASPHQEPRGGPIITPI